MEALTIEAFKPKAISADEMIYGETINYTSVKFSYDEGELPPICIDGNFKLFRFRKKCGDTYSLSITCDTSNEWFFRELCRVISKETCKLVRKSIFKPEDFKLVKNNKSGQSVYAKLYTKKSGKVKCRISLGSSRNMIGVEELVDENFKGSCIIKIYQVYIGSVKSISFSVETENAIKHRINACDKASNANDETVASIFDNKFYIPLDFEILVSSLPLYQYGLVSRLT